MFTPIPSSKKRNNIECHRCRSRRRCLSQPVLLYVLLFFRSTERQINFCHSNTWCASFDYASIWANTSKSAKSISSKRFFQREFLVFLAELHEEISRNLQAARFRTRSKSHAITLGIFFSIHWFTDNDNDPDLASKISSNSIFSLLLLHSKILFRSYTQDESLMIVWSAIKFAFPFTHLLFLNFYSKCLLYVFICFQFA